MVSTEGCSEGTPGPNYNARSTECLLDPEATDDQHNVPLDADHPPAPEGSQRNCIVENMPKTEIPANVKNVAKCQCSYSKHWFISSPFFVIYLTFMLGFGLGMFIQSLQESDVSLVQTLIEKLDAQRQILTQMAANQHIAGHNPGGL